MKITEDELAQLLQDAAKAGVAEYKRQEKKNRRRGRYHDTYNLMRCYRDAVFHAQNTEDETEKAKTIRKLEYIDRAVEQARIKCEAAGRRMEYRAFELYFMQGKSYEQIAEQLDTSKNTPRNWVAHVINELSVLLWGFDEQ